MSVHAAREAQRLTCHFTGRLESEASVKDFQREERVVSEHNMISTRHWMMYAGIDVRGQ